ncbi:tetratricopeptide repeat protein [Mucilaginibacter sp. UR6-1]|uniref:tetratricopeptide repeat protein n=1 Tax=Mucilaginibacter sp. UR6-1 TaxID=1435643 RepID=UPI001E402C4A|nr:tetratricopeptide repeat protein [Mucilaginibacter sp. UR6-1]MCC8410796.1 tetratricopeptide repeat protein [Mucilaginibacter sp. UR6-1]
MKYVLKYLIIAVVFFIYVPCHAQDARSLTQQGIELADKQQYADAIEKYNAALKLEPNNTSANYRMAFSLNASGKRAEAIPYLQKVITSGASPMMIASAYSLLGNIYDKSAQPTQAIDSYLKAIKTDSADYTLHYNLALAYFRARQYNDAEKSALTVLATNPKHTGSMRLYALVTFHQNKRGPALLALCHFLSLEPKGASSTEAYGNLQSILKGGALKIAAGEKSPVIDASTRQLNQAITTAVNTVDKSKYTAPVTLLEKQLSAVFIQLGNMASKQTANPAFFKNIAAEYYQLAQTDRMPAFANFISQSVDKNAAAWVKAHSSVGNELGE